MFGAGTDYCLLIVARFRDELRAERGRARGDGARDRAHRPGDPLGRARSSSWRCSRSRSPTSTRRARWGRSSRSASAIMVAAGLTLLPAMLAALGRRVVLAGRAARRARGRRRRAGRGRRSPRASRRAPGADRRRASRAVLVGRRARQPRRPRAARLRRGVPRPARVGARRRQLIARPLHPRPRRARPGRDALRRARRRGRRALTRGRRDARSRRCT